MHYVQITRPGSLHPHNVNTSSYSSLDGAISLSPNHTVVPARPERPNRTRQSTSPRPVRLREMTIQFASGRGARGILFSEVKATEWGPMAGEFVPELQSLGQRSINLHISVRAMCCIDTFAEADCASQWPGYAHITSTYPLQLFDINGPVSRFRLAKQIVASYDLFFAHARGATYGGRPDENGTTWEIGPNYSRLDFRLRSLHNRVPTADGAFQAEIEVIWA
ncbi:hypothetical protein TRAPUB_36 [Trametes pubescens]|uniref:Uncharacterized protein n=1 Tax=Trametes pubescens TaxID=154538 RepID=A0A1M2VN37_TRAPU|nr:hypothetical protein TRAPUB_36 [Trametes pubescens]